MTECDKTIISSLQMANGICSKQTKLFGFDQSIYFLKEKNKTRMNTNVFTPEYCAVSKSELVLPYLTNETNQR